MTEDVDVRALVHGGRSRPAQAGRDSAHTDPRGDLHRLVAAAASGTRRRCRSRSTSSFSTIPRCARCISASVSSSRISPTHSASHSPRDRVPAQDWILAVDRRVLRRVSVPVLSRSRRLGPASRRRSTSSRRSSGCCCCSKPRARVVGPPLAVIATLMLVYAFAGRVHARRDSAQGRVAFEGRVALLAVSTEGVFGVAVGRIGELHLPVRAVRLAAREGGRRQLFHQGRVRVPRSHARRVRRRPPSCRPG